MLARTWKVLRLWGAALIGGLALGATAQAQDGMGAVAAGPTPAGCASCAPCVQYEANKHCCPPHVKHYQEGPPKLCFKKACPKPICDPCELKHYGYYQTCWHAYPFPPDWSHCAAPPVGALLPPCCPHKSQVKEEKPADKMPPADPLPKPKINEGARQDRPPTWLPPASIHQEPVNTSVQPVSTQPVPPVKQTSAPAPAPSPSPYQMTTPPRPLPSLPEQQWTPPAPPMPTSPVKDGPPLMPIQRTSLEQKPEENVVTQAVVKEPITPPAPLPASVVSSDASGVKILAGPKPQAPVAPAEQLEPTGERPRPGQSKSVLPNVRMVNSQQILLDFNAKELSAEQRASLELWSTRDGRKWTRDTLAKFQDTAILTQVSAEGAFGYTVMQRQRDGSGPKAGDQPQMWVEADWNKPAVRLIDARYQKTPQARQILLAWTANDRNLAEQPVALSYATSPDGPWTTFAPSVANSGRYVWTLPGHINGPVHVRVEAFHLMGNVGLDQTAQPIATTPASGMAVSR